MLSAVAGAFFLPLRIGSVPFPISALLSGLVNAALVWAALQLTSSPRVAALPLWCWLLTVAGLTFGGPGDDIVFGGVGITEYAPLLLIVWARCRLRRCCGAMYARPPDSYSFLPVASFLSRFAPVSSFVAAEADGPDVASAVWPSSLFLLTVAVRDLLWLPVGLVGLRARTSP